MKFYQRRPFHCVCTQPDCVAVERVEARVAAIAIEDDEEDQETTLESIKMAERMTGGKMAQPSANFAQYVKTGNPM